MPRKSTTTGASEPAAAAPASPKPRAPKGGNGDGGIRLRADGRYEARYTDVDGTSRTLMGRKGESKEAVRKRLREALAKRDDGISMPKGRQTVAAYLTEWLEQTAQARVRASTFKSYESLVRVHLQPALGRVGLKELSPLHIRRFLNEKAKASSARRVGMMHAVLLIALNDARRLNLVGQNAAELVRPPRTETRKVRAVSRHQAHAILDAFAGHRWRALVTVALSLGLRQGEALGLRWADVDLDGRRLHVRYQMQRIGRVPTFVPPKSESGERTLIIPPTIADELRAQRRRVVEMRLAAGDDWQDLDLVFPTRRGTPIDGSSLLAGFKRQLAAAGLPPMRFHDLRHAAATLLLAQGVTLHQVKATLGHSTIVLTSNTYGHVTEELLTDVADHMEAILRRAT